MNEIEGDGLFDVRYGYSNATQSILDKYGGQTIKKLRVSRLPLTNKIQYALRLVNKEAKNIYDDLFHLALIATMDQRDIRIEKNEVIDIEDSFQMKSNMELRDVNLHGRQITLNELMDKTRQGMGIEKFYTYSAWTNNCQYFVDAILKYNNLLTPELHSFLFQDLSKIIDTTPWLARKFADFVTHTAGWFNKILGRGEDPIFFDDVERSALENDYFRKVVYTTNDKNMQFVYMSIEPRGDIGMEKHDKVDQFFRVESGKGKLLYGEDGKKRFLKQGEAFIIPAGTYHNIKNSSYTEPLKLYTLYSPANHEQGVKQKKKPTE